MTSLQRPGQSASLTTAAGYQLMNLRLHGALRNQASISSQDDFKFEDENWLISDNSIYLSLYCGTDRSFKCITNMLLSL